MTLSRVLIVAGLLLLSACGSRLPIEAQRANGPPISEFLLDDGAQVWGVVEDRNGNVMRRFTVDITSTGWISGTLQTTEKIEFDDGETGKRVWTWRRGGPNEIIGTAGDVIGEISTRMNGSVLTKTYSSDTKMPDGSIRRLTFEDWLYRIDERNLICRSFVSFRGIPVGQVTSMIRLNRPV